MKRPKRKRPRGLGTMWQRGGSWWIQWREGGRRRSASYPSKEIAEQVLAKIVSDVARGRGGLEPDAKASPPLASLATDWLERRRFTHRAHRDDSGRWRKHLGPFFGTYRPGEVDVALIRRFVEAKLADLSSTTVGHCLRLLSTFFTDLKERGLSPGNPVKDLPRSTRRLVRNAHDPRTTPFLERKDDIRRVFLALAEPYSVAFAIGALAGLRTGEVLGLMWDCIDIPGRRMVVRQQVSHGRLGPVKDDDSRIVPILDSLLPILKQWQLCSGGQGLVVRPKHPTRGGRPGSPSAFLKEHTLHKHLRKALDQTGLWRDEEEPGRRLNWYRCTRHTFASHWILDERGAEKLQAILGHEDLSTTQRYSHLRPGLFSAADLGAIAVDLSSPTGRVIPLARPEPAAVGNGMATAAEDDADEVG